MIFTEGGALPGVTFTPVTAAVPLNLNSEEVVGLIKDALRSNPLLLEINE